MNKCYVTNEVWDVLIVLDACRFDYFEKVCHNYFDGILEKRLSCGSCTPEWRDKNFKKYNDDIVYVSSNPYIKDAEDVPNKLFYKTYDVWKTHWDSNIGTVRPEHVSDVSLASLRDNPGKRTIIHYLQPHAPYLSIENTHGFSPPKDQKPFLIEKTESQSTIRHSFFNYFSKVVRNFTIISNHCDWYLAQMLKIEPQSPMDVIRRLYGVKFLKDAYENNLNLVLSEVAYLASNISPEKTVIITSDHGELLGEKRWFAHPYGSNNPILRVVPWFKINEVKYNNFSERVCRKANDNCEYSIENKLKDLGYL